MDILSLIGRKEALFTEDIKASASALNEEISNSSFLVLGGAGSIGQATTKELFKRNPRKLHVVDISENNLVELVRDLRSSFGYISGDFKTFALEIGSKEYDAFWAKNHDYDYVLNLAALKHVRSEKDPYTLMRLIDVNIFSTDKTARQAAEQGLKKYFCVSTDKAANPVNMMGASKRIMEMFLMSRSTSIDISMARFANVAFSDGSLLHGFNKRMEKRQPIVAPNDVKRYFVTPQESGELCMMSAIFGENRDIFFPKLTESLHLITFAEIAEKYLNQLGYTPYLCENEEEARAKVSELASSNQWPCLFTKSDTTGEKDFEEFFVQGESLDLNRFNSLGIIKNSLDENPKSVGFFRKEIEAILSTGIWGKEDLVRLFKEVLPNFDHWETGKYLDSKM